MNIIRGKIDCKPELVGYDSDRITALERHFERLVNENIIHGASYCISRKGKIIADGAVGYGSIHHDKDMQTDTIFRIASQTKVFTATAVMQLVEDGLISLNTPVGDILPRFRKEPLNNITVWNLLTHTSGLYPDPNCFPSDNDKTAWALIDKAAEGYTGKPEDFDWLTAATSAGLRVPTGSQWQYCTFGFVIAGEIITRVSGMDTHDYICEHILKPLGMTDSGFKPDKSKLSRYYAFDAEDEEMFSLIAAGKKLDNGIWNNIPSTGGGLYSTVTDLIRFGNAMLYNGALGDTRILGRKTAEKMHTLQLVNTPDYCWGANTKAREYGVGFDMRTGPAYTYTNGTYCHEGAGVSCMDIDPTEELVAAWFVPLACPDWSSVPLYNTQNVIWSGLI